MHLVKIRNLNWCGGSVSSGYIPHLPSASGGSCKNIRAPRPSPPSFPCRPTSPHFLLKTQPSPPHLRRRILRRQLLPPVLHFLPQEIQTTDKHKKVDVLRRSRKLQKSPEIIKVEGNHATTKHHPQKRIRKLDYLPVRFLIHFRKHGIPGVIIIHCIKSVCHRFQRLQQT